MVSRSDFLICGARLVPMSAGHPSILDADILVRDGRIEQIAPHNEIDAGENVERIDARGALVLPGFVDTHRHTWQTQLRGVATNWSLFDYSVNMRWRFGGCYDEEDAYLGNYIGALEALNAGITTLVDHSHITISPEHSERALGALRDSGIRGVWCFGAFRNPDYDAHDNVQDALLEGFAPVPQSVIDTARDMSRSAFAGESDLLQFGWAANEFEWYDTATIEKELATARELGAAVISMHAGMGALKADVRLIPLMADAGLLEDDMLFVHGGNFFRCGDCGTR